MAPAPPGGLGIAVDATGSLTRPRRRGMGMRLAAAIAVTFIALILLVAATWVASARMIADAEEVTRTRRVIIALDDTLFSLKDSEINLKAYLLTHRPEDVRVFREGVVELVRRLSRIATLAGDDPNLKARAPALRKLSEEAGSELKAAAEILQAGYRDEALRGVSEVRAHRAMDDIRRLVGDLTVEERARLGTREEGTRSSIRNFIGTLTAGAALQFGLLFTIWYLIRGDMARRDRTEAAIRDREARIRRLVNSNLIGVLFSAPDGVTEANDAFLSIVGLSRVDWEPKRHPFSFTAPEYQRLDQDCERELRAVGTCRPFQKELVRKDGTRVPVLFGAAVVEPSADRPVWASFVVDLSELKRVERERDRLYQEARDAVEARDAFLSVAGHEIRTPLSALNLLLYQLSRRLKTVGDEKAKELAAKCETQMARLLRLTEELLDVSRISAGQVHLDLHEVDLAALAKEIAERLEDGARRAGSAITLDAPPQLIGFWDRSRIDQVLTNLLTNAIKFGGGEPIELRLRAERDLALVTVRDSGIGISAEDQARIFERFQRAVPKQAYRGMGLGLWIVKQLVEAHGGTIAVESRPGAGSTFTVTLPRHAEGA